MTGQFSLFGDDPAPAPRRGRTPPTDGRNGLFFALFAPGVHAESIARMAAALDRELGLRARAVLEPGRLHVTLLDLGSYDALPRELVDVAVRAASGVSLAPFEVAFDRLAGFGRGGATLVLRGDAGEQPVDALHRALDHAMTRAAVPCFKRFQAHMTLAYLGAEFVGRGTEPVRWTATEFALVFSHVGKHRHEILGRWPLRA